MAAEDYIDDYFPDPFDHHQNGEPDFTYTCARNEARTLLLKKQPVRHKAEKKNKDIEWVTGQGEIIKIADMEDSHISNTIAYIVRRMKYHQEAADMLHAMGLIKPPYIINRRPGTEWLNIFGKEASRRTNKGIKKAKNTLAQNSVTI